MHHSADEPVLTTDERQAINAGRWFSGLSPTLRHDILRRTYVRKFGDGQNMSLRGAAPREWIACASGNVRVSAATRGGKELTLTYVRPGVWFGDIALVDDLARTHDTWAEGDTTVVCVSREDFHLLLDEHAELHRALLRLNVRRLRQAYEQLQDMATLPLRLRLGKLLVTLARSHGVDEGASGTRIALALPQEDLAQLLGASRQRVNQTLKALEREELIRLRATGIVIRSTEALCSDARAA